MRRTQVVAAFAVGMAVVLIAGCGGGNGGTGGTGGDGGGGPDFAVGTWETFEYSDAADGPRSPIEDFFGPGVVEALTFRADGTCTLAMELGASRSLSENGSWRKVEEDHYRMVFLPEKTEPPVVIVVWRAGDELYRRETGMLGPDVWFWYRRR